MMKVRNFNENLEESLVKVGREVQRQIERPEMKALSEREVVKQSIQSIASETAAPSVLPQPAKSEEAQNQFLPGYLEGDQTSPTAKQDVQELVDLVFESGLEKAIGEAKKQPPFVEDAFHDALTDKLLPELKNRGILKQH